MQGSESAQILFLFFSLEIESKPILQFYFFSYSPHAIPLHKKNVLVLGKVLRKKRLDWILSKLPRLPPFGQLVSLFLNAHVPKNLGRGLAFSPRPAPPRPADFHLRPAPPRPAPWIFTFAPQNKRLPRTFLINIHTGSLGVNAIGDDEDLSHVYLPNLKQL